MTDFTDSNNNLGRSADGDRVSENARPSRPRRRSASKGAAPKKAAKTDAASSRSSRPVRERETTARPVGQTKTNNGEVASFDTLGLGDDLLRAVEAAGYTEPTPIQVQAIPPGLAGRDVLGAAQTGTGKTAAFALPILERLQQFQGGHVQSAGAKGGGKASGGSRRVRALILAPTRELAAQIAASFERYGRGSGLRTTVVFGGVSKSPQYAAFRRGVDILVATPGRLLDLMGERIVSLQNVQVLVLDEADRMLDMGFIHDVRRILRDVPKERQTMLFSATLPVEIQKLAHDVLDNPVRVAVAPVATTLEATAQSVYAVDKSAKVDLLLTLLQDESLERVLVFTRTKHGANKVEKKLSRAGVSSAALHGNKSQNARERALEGFKLGHTRVIVATDIAARGLDVKGLTHVINFDLPHEPETYVHRIGRTGRAGAVGVALSFCAPDERSDLLAIERLTRRPIDRATMPELIHVPLAPLPKPQPASPRSRRSASDSRGSNRSAGGRATKSPSRPSRSRSARPGQVAAKAERPARDDRPQGAGKPSGAGRAASGRSKSSRGKASTASGSKSSAPWWQGSRESGSKGSGSRSTRKRSGGGRRS